MNGVQHLVCLLYLASNAGDFTESASCSVEERSGETHKIQTKYTSDLHTGDWDVHILTLRSQGRAKLAKRFNHEVITGDDKDDSFYS